MRRATVNRETRETKIRLSLALEGRGRYEIATGIRFFDHMLELVARHGAFDLTLRADGDLDVDQHHTVEDVGIALGEAVTAALGTRRGINRAGYFVMPMDETLAVVALDLESGAIRWARQLTPGDVYVAGCGPSSTNSNCAGDLGPDYDFGQAPMLASQPDGRDHPGSRQPRPAYGGCYPTS